MRQRMRGVAVVAAAVLAVSGLAGCRTNVGVAATVEGHRITESQVSQYLTSKAQPLKTSSQSGASQSVPPRSFVLNILIKQRLYLALLRKTPKGVPSDGAIAAAVQQQLKGKTERQVVEGLGVKGYSDAFNRFILKFSVLGGQLDSDVQGGVDVNKIVSKLTFPVSVNPRYGSWDPKGFNLTADTAAGLPSFITLQPSASAAAQPAG